MAKRRMFSLDVVNTDAFLDLPASSQSLYFHLGMRADDDGFVSSPKRITAMVNASADDLKLLIAKGFVIPFDSGVCVIRDWKVNNYIQNDRYTPTLYSEEKMHLICKKSGQYDFSDTPCIQTIFETDTQVRIGEISKGKRKSKSVKADKPPRAPRFTPPTLAEVQSYVAERHSAVDPQGFIDFYAAKGWLVGKSPMRDWKAACRNAESWERWAKQPNSNRIRTSDEYAKGADFFG